MAYYRSVVGSLHWRYIIWRINGNMMVAPGTVISCRWSVNGKKNRNGKVGSRNLWQTYKCFLKLHKVSNTNNTMTAWNSNSRGSDASFWSMQASGIYMAHRYILRQNTHPQKIKLNKWRRMFILHHVSARDPSNILMQRSCIRHIMGDCSRNFIVLVIQIMKWGTKSLRSDKAGRRRSQKSRWKYTKVWKKMCYLNKESGFHRCVDLCLVL